MSLYQVNAGDRILAVDNIQFYNILKGVAASGENILLIYNAGALTFQPSSDPAAGTRVLAIKNNAGTTLFAARYDGLLEMLAAAAAPGSPVAGSAYFDTLLSFFRVYDGTNWVSPANQPQPNQCPNSDFSRRTVFGLAMPEVFADTSGYVLAADAGADPTVAANILTFNTASHVLAWPKSHPGNFWRDGRVSATFKAVATAGDYTLYFRYVDASNNVLVRMNAGNFQIYKQVAGTPTQLATVAQALTLNRWYWLELEMQGTTVVAKIWDTGGTVSGVTKASSTLLQTLTGTAADAAVVTGDAAIASDQSTAQWGGIATGNGGVYVETWLPESNTFTFSGTLGGQAVGYDESADAGMVAGGSGKQWAMRAYCPAASRIITIDQKTPDGSVVPSATYAASGYLKVSGKGGSGNLIVYQFLSLTSADANVTVPAVLSDGGATTWTRKTQTFDSGATARKGQRIIYVNPDSTATGTAYFMLPQLEQGSAVTAWRNAPADDAPIVWTFASTKDVALAAAGEIDSRDLGANIFLPWDANITVAANGIYDNSGANANYVKVSVDAVLSTAVADLGGTTIRIFSFVANSSLASGLKHAAGKTRIALAGDRAAGTETFRGSGYAPTTMTITATRGK